MARPREGAEIPLPCQVPGTRDRKIEPSDKVRILPQTLLEAQPAELHVEVPENYGGNFPLYLTKVSLSPEWAVFLPPALFSLSGSGSLLNSSLQRWYRVND